MTICLNSLPTTVLTHMLSNLPSAADLARASASCTELRQAVCWRTAFARFYGEHSAHWAEVAAAGQPVDFRRLVAMRMASCVSRAAGQSYLRTLYYSFGPNPTESDFLPSTMSLDGPYLALGDYSGAVSLWDLRPGRRLWRIAPSEARTPGLPDIGEVSAVHCCHLGRLFVSSHVSASYTTLTVWVRAFADGRALRRILLFPCVSLPDPSLPHVGLEVPVLHVHLYSPERLLSRAASSSHAYEDSRLEPKLLAVVQDEANLVPSPKCLTCLTFGLPGIRGTDLGSSAPVARSAVPAGSDGLETDDSIAACTPVGGSYYPGCLSAGSQRLERSFAPLQGLMSEQAGVMAEVWVRPIGGGGDEGERGNKRLNAGGGDEAEASMATDALAFPASAVGGDVAAAAGGVAGAQGGGPEGEAPAAARTRSGYEVCLRLVDVHTLRLLGACVLWRRWVNNSTASSETGVGGADGSEIALQACSLQWRSESVAWLFVQEETSISSCDMEGWMPPFSYPEKMQKVRLFQLRPVLTAWDVRSLGPIRAGERVPVPPSFSSSCLLSMGSRHSEVEWMPFEQHRSNILPVVDHLARQLRLLCVCGAAADKWGGGPRHATAVWARDTALSGGAISCIDLRNEWRPNATEPSPIAIIQRAVGLEMYDQRSRLLVWTPSLSPIPTLRGTAANAASASQAGPSDGPHVPLESSADTFAAWGSLDASVDSSMSMGTATPYGLGYGVAPEPEAWLEEASEVTFAYASAEMRRMLTSSSHMERVGCFFERADGIAPVGNWRWLVLAHREGLHVFDWLPRRYWSAAAATPAAN